MAIRKLEHKTATTLKQAMALATKPGLRTAVVAGGTDLLGVLKDNIHASYPDVLVDVKPIQGLADVKVGKKGLKVGALTRLADVATHPAVREGFGALAEAARSVASPQIRNMATVGGNLCQEPRCWYYRTPENLFDCLRKGGDICGAILGDNRYHSIFGAARSCAPGCSQGCPAHVAIPFYLEKMRSGELALAARMLLENNPLPAITGRVCPHDCQSHCSRVEFDEPVATRDIERFLGDHVLEHAGTFLKAPKKESGKKIAVVGAGPAGLAAAYYLRKAGHAVTVYDRMAEPGGMLRYSIPAYRLPKDVLARQIDAFVAMGITFVQHAELGGNLTLKELRKGYDGVFLGTGGWKQRTLGLEHEELLGSGLDFLQGVATGDRAVPGKHVLVIGGGSVAVDVAISALRLGAGKVTMACLEARDAMPAIPEDLEQALEEKIELLPSFGPRKVLVRAGKLAGLELVRCTSVFDADGRFRPSFDPATTTAVKADCVLVAIGQGPDLSWAGAELATARGALAADPDTQATSLAHVYAGGDLVTGASTVIAGIAAGKRAALSLDADLGGKGLKSEIDGASSGADVNVPALTASPAAFAPWRPLGSRTIDLEDTSTITLRDVEIEAGRCLNCGCVAVNASDLAPALIALDATIETTARTFAAEDFFGTGTHTSTRLAEGELVTGVSVPTPPAGAIQGYQKFRVRNAIDFPIVGVASVLTLKRGKITSARVALGAVAPTPLRAREVEEFLVGKEPAEEVAEVAASIAVRGVQPLAGNAFKVQIVRALVKKAVLGLIKA